MSALFSCDVSHSVFVDHSNYYAIIESLSNCRGVSFRSFSVVSRSDIEIVSPRFLSQETPEQYLHTRVASTAI